MVDLNNYLKLNSNAIIDLAERKYVPAEMSQESTFEGLATLLQGKFTVQHGSKAGKRDPAHNVLAMVIIYSMWCGWPSQAKANRGGYPREWVDSFKKLIVDAFEIGQKYSISD